MKAVAPLSLPALTQRIGRFYTGRPSWRTGLRGLRRRLGKRALPLSDEERLRKLARVMRRKRRAGGEQTEPVRALRIVRPLPLVFLAADGRTTFRYGRALKNASSSVLYMLLQITGEAAYYPWDERKHFWLMRRRIWRPRVLEKRSGIRFKQHIRDDERLIINDEQMRLHQYAPLRYYEQPVHPLPDIRFCLVRDPVERFVSAYQQLVIDSYRVAYGERKRFSKLRAQGGGQNRRRLLDIDRFIAAKEAEDLTREDSDRHFRSQKWFLGCPDYYTHIFSVLQLEEVHAFLSELMQKPLGFPSINRLHRKQQILAMHPATRQLDFTMPPLTAKQRQRIENLYAEDYQAFGRYF